MHSEGADKSHKLRYEYNGERISPWHQIPLIAGVDTADTAFQPRCSNRDLINPECHNPSGCPSFKCAVPQCPPGATALTRWRADGCRGCLECVSTRVERLYHFVCEIPRGTTAKFEINKKEDGNPLMQVAIADCGDAYQLSGRWCASW